MTVAEMKKLLRWYPDDMLIGVITEEGEFEPADESDCPDQNVRIGDREVRVITLNFVPLGVEDL